jgi:hypothetical protein
MEIKLDGYELRKAVEDYIKLKYNIDFDFMEDSHEYPRLEYSKPIYEAKKHKNGRVMKHPEHGYVMQQVVRYENLDATINDNAYFCFHTFFAGEDDPYYN